MGNNPTINFLRWFIMYAITEDIVNIGILKYDIQKEEECNGGVLIYLNKEEALDSCFFNRIFEVQKKYGCNVNYRYSEEYDSIVIVIH